MDNSEAWNSATDTGFLEAEGLLESIELDTDDLSGLLTCLSPLNPNDDDNIIASVTPSFATVERQSAALSMSNSDGGDSFDGCIWRCDGETSSAPSRSSETVTSPSKCKRPRRSDSNKAREGRRRELLCLRQSATQLEQELASLQLEKGPVTTIQKQQDGGEAQLRLHHRLGPWETIAEHQKRERRRVEEENVRLRVELDTQLKFATTLERLVRQSLRQQAAEGCHHSDALQRYMDHSQLHDRSVFEALIRAMEQQYQSVDARFDRLGINDIEYSHHGSRVYRRESGVEIEVFHNEVLPVSIEVAGDIVWHNYAYYMAQVPHRHYYQRTREVVYTSADTILEVIGIKFNFNGISAHVREQQVIRRFVEADRIVIMLCSNFHTVEYSDRPTVGMVFRRNGCLLFKRSKTFDPSELSVLKTSTITTPMLDGTQLNPSGVMVKELVDFLLSEGAASAAVMHQVIENMLMREAMRNKRPQLRVS